MARRPSKGPTEGELEILQVLWERGPSGLGQVRKALQDRRDVATSTVATMLSVMREKGLLHRKDGPRGYLWSARISRRTATRGLVRTLVDRLFDGSAERLVAHLFEVGELEETDMVEIRRAIQQSSERRGRRG